MKDYFVRIAYNSDTDIWEEIDEELNSELIEISKAPLALYKKAKFLEKENLRYKTQLESGELCNREEVKKEMAGEILKNMLNKMCKLAGGGVPYRVKKNLLKKLQRNTVLSYSEILIGWEANNDQAGIEREDC